jgi:hypothetical protein
MLAKPRCGEAGCHNEGYYMVRVGHMRCSAHIDPHHHQLESPLTHKQYQQIEFASFVRQLFDECLRRNVRGAVECLPLATLKTRVPLDWLGLQWLCVFPHGAKRYDGHSVPGLAPASMGPVAHGEPGMPDTLFLENFHQATLCWPGEVDAVGQVLPIWRERRDRLMVNVKGEHHKLSPIERVKRQPLYAMHVTITGEERYYTLVEARVFYGCWYEHLVVERPAFLLLRSYRETRGISLRITGKGLGARALRGTHADAFYADFVDPELPLGHEHMLAAMLLAAGQECQELPWRRYLRLHPTRFEGMCLPAPAVFENLK